MMKDTMDLIVEKTIAGQVIWCEDEVIHSRAYTGKLNAGWVYCSLEAYYLATSDSNLVLLTDWSRTKVGA